MLKDQEEEGVFKNILIWFYFLEFYVSGQVFLRGGGDDLVLWGFFDFLCFLERERVAVSFGCFKVASV